MDDSKLTPQPPRSVMLPLTQIKPNPGNPRIIKDDKFKKLVQSLKDFPEMAGVMLTFVKN